MNHRPHDPEQALLQHYREHATGEPSAALDARILAAASAAVAQAPVATPNWHERLHGWIFGSGARLRWSVAFASLATVGLGLSLTWRTLDEAPNAYDQAVPMVVSPRMQAPKPEAPQAEMSQAYAPPVAPAMPAPAEMQRKQAPVSARSAAAPAPLAKQQAQAAEVLADAVAGDELAEQAVTAFAKAPKKPLEPTVQQALEGILKLREAGEQKAADEALQQLQKAYPQHDLPAELLRLQRLRQEKPISSQ